MNECDFSLNIIYDDLHCFVFETLANYFHPMQFFPWMFVHHLPNIFQTDRFTIQFEAFVDLIICYLFVCLFVLQIRFRSDGIRIRSHSCTFLSFKTFSFHILHPFTCNRRFLKTGSTATNQQKAETQSLLLSRS